MKILITNDDGIYAEGLLALCRRLHLSHNVVIIAPEREKSAVGHGITLHKPLRVTRPAVTNHCPAYAVSGTPADCIKLGLLELMEQKPEMVISGINAGANVGVNVNYSGTVAAAREAALYGIPGIAVAIDGRNPEYYDQAAEFVEMLAEKIHSNGLPRGTFLNVNIPDAPLDRISGVRVSSLEIALYGEYVEKRSDPRSGAYYWQGCDTRNVFKDPEGDGVALLENYIAITPILCDTTDYRMLKEMKKWTVLTRLQNRPTKKE